MSLSVEFGKRMQKKRKEKGMTQKELAGLIDVDVRRIYNLEHGLVEPKLRTLIAISIVLDISLDELKQYAEPDEKGIYWKSPNAQ